MLDLVKFSFDIRIEGDEWNSIKPILKYDKDRIDQRFQSGWSRLVSLKIWQTVKLPCSFVFKRHKFYKNSDFPYFQLFGYCSDKSCKQDIIGICENNEYEDNVTIKFECLDTTKKKHTKKLPLSGPSRDEAKKDLRNMKPAKYRQRLANNFLNDSGGDCPFVSSTHVYATARQESVDNFYGISNHPGDVITSVLLVMKNIPYSIREFSTIPFYIYYYTENQLSLWKELHGLSSIVISIDATGSYVRAPIIFEDNKSSYIFLYNIVCNFKKNIFTLTQFLSSVHDTHNIFLWLKSWINNGAPVPREIVMDGSKALLNAVSLAFNSVYFDMYLEKCFDCLLNPEHQLPKCLIKRDRAHLIKNISQLSCFKNQNWLKKDFYLRVIGFSFQIDSLKLLEDVIVALFTLCESHYTDKGSNCWKKKNGYLKKFQLSITKIYIQKKVWKVRKIIIL